MKRTLANWLGGRRHQRMPDLGAREMAVLECLWRAERASAQDVLRAMDKSRITLSTVQSTLERLHRKRLVRRDKEGRAYRYTPVLSRPQLIGRLLRDIADEVAGGELAPMMSGFVDYVAGEAPEIEAELARLIDGGERGDE